MVDEARQISSLGGVNDRISIDPEEVAAPDAKLLVPSLPLVGGALPDGLPDVLDDHLIGRDGLHGVQTPAVDTALQELQLLLTELK